MSAPAGRWATWRQRARGSMRARGPSAPAAPAPAPDEALLDEQTMGRLRRLSLVAGRARTEGLAGEHRSRRRGASPEFADFKAYSQGDDFRRIDWNTYARLGTLFVRLSEITTELSVHILLDSSASMDWRGHDGWPTKHTAARQLAGALGYVALWGFDRVAVVPFAEGLGRPFGPVQGRAQVVPLIRYLRQVRPLGGTALAPAVTTYARTRSRPGLLLLITDCLSGEPEELRSALHDLRGRGWQTSLLHVVDEAEVSAEATSSWLRGEEDAGTRAVELIDRETGETLRMAVDDDLIARYQAAVSAWLAGVESACAAEGAAYARVSTAWSLDDVTLTLLHQQGVVA